MGQVYLAQHPRLPRQDALKVLQPDLSNDGDFRQRFIREADLAASLSHPNIVKVHDRGEFEGQLWIATEYVDGTDAGQLLRERYPEGMPVEEACGILTAIASALDNAHDSGLLHRDIKPANIPLTKPDRFGQRQIYLAYSGPSATGSLTPDENGPFNVVVVAFLKTSAGPVASTVNMHCVRAGQNRTFETLAFADVRGPYELENIVAYPTSVEGAGPQYTPTC